MLEASRKRELLENARALSAELRGVRAGRAVWRHVGEALFRSKQVNRERAQQLIEALPASWLRLRSRSAPAQLGSLLACFRKLLQHAKTDEELRFLVGWTDRFVHLREKGLDVPRVATREETG